MEYFISIHAPLTGCDMSPICSLLLWRFDFNPRTPYGMRLVLISNLDNELILISIHAPLTGCDENPLEFSSYLNISIHAPLTGCDTLEKLNVKGGVPFQSTHPLRDATATISFFFSFPPISIHAPLTGCDYDKENIKVMYSNFNPRTPYGMRPPHMHVVGVPVAISIHAPLTGCDFRN